MHTVDIFSSMAEGVGTRDQEGTWQQCYPDVAGGKNYTR